MVRGVLGVVVGLVARLWLATLRVRVHMAPEARAVWGAPAPWVLAFWHGRQFPLLAWRRRRTTAVLVSLSADGAIQARALTQLGMEVVRGSSSRGGARGLAALVRRLRRGGRDAAFAIDGPRGPLGVAKPGVGYAAKRSGAWIVPMGSAAGRAKVLARAWDRFVLPLPGTVVVVTIGAPLPGDAAPGAIEAAVAGEVARAEALLAGQDPAVIAFAGISRSVECGGGDLGPTHHGSDRPSLTRPSSREEKVDHA
jgi:lysophospholipid acyltransferase (LPLAT)-like uncharacterized protein